VNLAEGSQPGTYGIVGFDLTQKKRDQELTDGRLGVLCGVEFYHSSTLRPTIRFVLDLGALDLANGREEIDQVFVASRPWKLLTLAQLTKKSQGRLTLRT
jgi:hypothetical protein